MSWTEVAGGTIDPVHKGIIGGTKVRQLLTLRANVHFPDYMLMRSRNLTEIEEGDCLVDFGATTVDFLGKKDVRIEISGKEYTPKAVGRKLAEAFDAIMGGVPLAKTVVLTPAR